MLQMCTGKLVHVPTPPPTPPPLPPPPRVQLFTRPQRSVTRFRCLAAKWKRHGERSRMSLVLLVYMKWGVPREYKELGQNNS